MFQTPPAQSSNPLPMPPQRSGMEGEFTRMMNAPAASSGNMYPTPTPQGDLFPSGPARGPAVDEFSKIAGSRMPAPPQAAPAPAKPKNSVLPLILILAGVLVIAIILVVLFAR